MQLCQIEQNGHLIRSNSIRHPSSGKPQVVNNFLTHSIPVGSNRLTVSNPYGISPISTNTHTQSTKDSSMNKSVYQKGENTDY